MKTIYIRTNKINGKQYVGQTIDMKRRERDWRKLGSSYSNQELNEDRIKYGFENFTLEILDEVEDSIADKTERIYIEKYNTMKPFGYNKYTGGIEGFTFQMDDETKEKISNTLKCVHQNHSVEGKQRIAEASKKRFSIPVDQIDPITGEVLATFPSAKEAARVLGLSQGDISHCCNGGFFSKQRNKWVHRNQYKGYLWKTHR